MARSGRPRQHDQRRQQLFHIAWAYDQLKPPENSADRVVFGWALARARGYDSGHEHEYPRGYDFLTRDMLLQLARDNVRDLVLAYPKIVK